MKQKFIACDIADKLYAQGFRFISGKVFLGKKEIEDFKKYMWKISWLKTIIRNTNDTQEIYETFKEMYSESNNWPELPIIEEAKALTELKPLAYPLTNKHLIILNRLLDPKDDHFFILCGIGGSGKSTVMDIYKQCFGNDYATINLDELGNDFKLAEAADKRLVCSDELNATDFNNGVIKTLSSRQPYTFNPKFEKPFKAIFQGRMIFCTNKPPRLDIEDSGIVRRIVYYFMNTKIETPNPDFKDKVYTHEELVNIVAHALRVDMTDWEEDFLYETRQLLKTGSSVWICKINAGLKDTEYPDYTDLCRTKGLKAFSQPKWESIKSVLLDWEREEYESLPF